MLTSTSEKAGGSDPATAGKQSAGIVNTFPVRASTIGRRLWGLPGQDERKYHPVLISYKKGVD